MRVNTAKFVSIPQIEGGEYLFDSSSQNINFALSSQGTIYDPVANTWTSVSPPPFFANLYPPSPPVPRYPSPFTSTIVNPIGDASSVVLPDGTFMLQAKLSKQAALLDTKTMTWTETGTGTKADINSEENWVLLPNGKILTVDLSLDYWFGLIPAYPTGPQNSELYDPATGTWSSAGSTISVLSSYPSGEMGPLVLRPNGTVFAVGDAGEFGETGGNTAIYNSDTNKWSAGPRFPNVSGEGQLGATDASGVLLPNGNVLVCVSPGEVPPAHFFEFDGKNLIEQGTILHANLDPAFPINMLLLPTGQVLLTDQNTDLAIYTPDTQNYNPSWAPVVTSYPSNVSPGHAYVIKGVRLNGMSQAISYGDDYQAATNFPLVRITNLATGHVFYSRTHDFSSMTVASSKPGSAIFDVPENQEKGPSKLEVVTNGIPSIPKFIGVK